jgi:spore photoproduct lyase
LRPCAARTLNKADSPEMISNERTILHTQTRQGEFWKPCPGTGSGYLCCNYQILTPLRGCGMYCQYCVLQVYFENQCQVLFQNYTDLEQEIAGKMQSWNGMVRFGTGEFSDSLWAESRLGLSRKIAATLEPYKNVVVEFKTKSANIDTIDSIERPERIIIGFSLNTPRMIDQYEKDTATLKDRFIAALKAEQMGYNVAFHFDPMFVYDGWEQEYCRVVRMIYDTIRNPSRIAWISLGAFRSNPLLKHALRRKNQHLPLYSGEMITGTDGKLRYFRPYRVALYATMQQEFEKHDPDAPLYLCMESRDVWEQAGMIYRIPKGLPAYLDARAEKMLKRES